VGRGTTFAIVLPATEGTVVFAREKALAPAPRLGHESILLVEDEAQVRRLVQSLLQSSGYHVQIAHTGVEALHLWERDGDTIDLVLTDIIMPGGVSGRELADALSASRPGLKVVYMSGYAGEAAGPGLTLKEGANFLQKPFGRSALLTCIRSRLDER
jgi:two-component system, cell cycle sensor histidine kinase and response regulator CckA